MTARASDTLGLSPSSMFYVGVDFDARQQNTRTFYRDRGRKWALTFKIAAPAAAPMH